MTRTVQRSVLVALAVAAALGAGCLDPGTSDRADAMAEPGAGPPIDGAPQVPDASDLLGDAASGGAWSLGLENCQEGGFVAMYSMQEGATLAGVWVLADVREEAGNPVRDGLGMPITGPVTANWHLGTRCATATFDGQTLNDFVFGWAGRMVLAPDWDPGGADLHFLLAGYGFQDGPVRNALAATTTADLTTALDASVTWTADAVVHTVYDDREKGTFESRSLVEKYRDVGERTIRFWWQVPADGSQADMGHGNHAPGHDMGDGDAVWHPVYWDVTTTGGPQFTTSTLASFDVSCHWQDGAHGTGGACQPTLTNIYQHGALEIHYGGVFPDVTIDDIWIH